MQDLKLCESEYRFMQIVWEAAPLTSGQLAALCLEKLGWKKSTTYTVLKKLCGRGFVQNQKAVVTPLVKREDVQSYQSEVLVERTFLGSLPAFIAAFVRGRKLDEEEAEEIKRMIDQSRRGPQ